MLNYVQKFEEAMKKLAELVLSGKIKVQFYFENEYLLIIEYNE